MKNITIIIPFCISIISCDSTSSMENSELDRWWTEDDQQLIISELNRSTHELGGEIENITDDQWNYREDTTRWSIAEIVEHLQMQNQLHYREISVMSKAPQYLQFRSITEGKDVYFSNYSTDTTRGKAQWFLEPLGRFCSLKDGEAAFYKVRRELTQLIEQTDVDFRKQFTFRVSVERKEITDIKIGEVRDLHQLLLTGIAHTDRHLNQIRKIKLHQDYPKKMKKELIETNSVKN